MDIILISSYGLSVFGFVFELQMFWMTSMPRITRPKTVCLLSNHCCRNTQIKQYIQKKNQDIHSYRWQNRNEELTAIRIRTSIGHAHSVWSIVFQRRHKLILEVTAPYRLTTSSGASWIPSLHHKALDNAMENMSVVVTGFAVDAKVLDRFGTFGGEEFHVNVAQCCVNGGRAVDALDAYVIFKKSELVNRKLIIFLTDVKSNLPCPVSIEREP